MYPETWKVIIFYYSSMQWQGEWQILNDICIKKWIKNFDFYSIFRIPNHNYTLFQIREDWKFVAMVVDRAQLWIFFLVTTIGTIGILMDAPHIFEFVDQDRIIDIYRGKWKVILFCHIQCAVWYNCQGTSRWTVLKYSKTWDSFCVELTFLRQKHFEDILTKWK